MKALVTLTFCALLVTAPSAFADANVALKPPRVYTGNHPPTKTTKPSSFAPQPGSSKRRVYGAPIQGPIFKTQPKKPKTTTPPKRP
jgi:hypothetical protein